MPFLARLAARLVRASTLVDRAAQRFDQLRSLSVLAFASDDFLKAYNDVAFSATSAFKTDTATFRHDLYHWEQEAVDRFFPTPPATILIGGAGGGREPFALAAQGYTVVGFDPALPLIQSMHARAMRDFPGKIATYSGSYGDLPQLRDLTSGVVHDLREQAPFAAAILGWTSFSHMTDDRDRVDALQRMAALTDGPLLVSFFSSNVGAQSSAGSGGVLGGLRARSRRRGEAIFAPAVGFARLLADGEIEVLAAQAGLQVLFVDRQNSWPHAVLAKGHPPQ